MNLHTVKTKISIRGFYQSEDTELSIGEIEQIRNLLRFELGVCDNFTSEKVGYEMRKYIRNKRKTCATILRKLKYQQRDLQRLNQYAINIKSKTTGTE